MATTDPFGDLTDPRQWDALVSDPAKLKQWVISQAPKLFGAKPDLADYYVGAIQRAPGANDTEKAGSAKYWFTDKISQDPSYGQYDGAGTPSTPASTPAATPAAAPPATALGAPPQINTKGPFGALKRGLQNTLNNPGLPGAVAKVQGAKLTGPGTPVATPGAPPDPGTTPYATALGAANRTRKKATGGGRDSTILAGFAAGRPTTYMPTVLGG